MVNLLTHKNIYLLISLILFINLNTRAQEYWQQEVNYKIDVTLNDSLHTLSAYENIEYINNSPDTLNFIWFHLWPNGYSGNKTEFWKQKLKNFAVKEYFDYQKNAGYIDSLNFTIDGVETKWEYHTDYIDICKVHLPEMLLPGEKINISTPFFVKIPPSKYSRLGHAKKTYQITQWYPKPAVYDKYGWHEMPYLNMGEFYSEFGSFDVKITIPVDYVVGATGNLQTQSEIDWLNTKSKQSSLFLYINQDSTTNKFKTIQYTENNIHDFAWFADKNFHVRKSEVILPNSGRKVTTWAMFTGKRAKLWEEATTYINDAIHYYSLWNGDYPYSNCTAIEGALSAGAGMEYPTITIIGSTANAFSLESVIMHEVGHNWFYGLWGFNERDFPYLDEGLNTANQLRYIETKYPNTKMYESQIGNSEVASYFDLLDQKYFDSYELAWILSEKINLNQKINSTSEGFHIMNYGIIAYFKAAHAWHYLRNYLGEDEFDRIMKVFYDKWKFKHPYPKDLQELFEEESGKDLKWFFDDVIASNKHIDYKIKKTKGDSILIKNKGEIAGPFQLFVSDNNSNIWHEGFTGKKWLNQSSGKTSKIILDSGQYTLDINRRNNTFTKGRLFPYSKPFRLQIVGSADNPDRNHLFWFPVIGLNGLNGFMPGVAFYNSFLPSKRFQFMFMPFYGLKNTDLAGRITLRYLSRNNFTYQLQLKQYGYSPETQESDALSYNRIQALINYRLHKDKSKGIWTDFYVSYVKLSDVFEINEFLNMEISHENRNKLYPYSLKARFELGEVFGKLSFEGRMRINYGWYKKNFELRVFTGIVDYSLTSYDNLYGFSMTSRSGYSDYQADYLFMGRSSGDELNPDMTSRQLSITDGGFVSYTPQVFSSGYLGAINLKTSLPKTNLLKIFLNLGIQKNKTSFFTLPNELLNLPVLDGLQYETGIELSVIPDYFEIYFPLIVSKDIKEISDKWTTNYWQKIRFTLKLDLLGSTSRVSDYLY